MLCVYNLVVCSSSNASFRTNSDTAASIGLLLCFWQRGGGAIINANFDANVGTVVITRSKFEGNSASFGNNIYKLSGEVTCNDGNTFESSGVPDSNSDSDGNSPAGLCD